MIPVNEIIVLTLLVPFVIGIALFSYGIFSAMWAKIRKIK